MQVLSCFARGTPGRGVLMDNVWHIRILPEMDRYRFVITPMFPVPGKNWGATC